MARKKPLSEQVLVVVGASSGVGRAVARAAGARGAKVVVAARSREALAAAAREVEGLGGEALAVTADVASDEDVGALVERTLERFGRVDSVVASAFVSVYAEIERLEIAELARVLDVNFLGRARIFRAVLPALRESRGTFVDVNSALAYRGIPLQAAYAASKAAGRAYFEAARVELAKARAGVDVCVLLPGAINTPHFERVRQKTGKQPRPVPPIYQPEVVAGAVLRCCERPSREPVVTWGGQKLLWGQKAAPRALDVFLRATGWSSQTTGEPKAVDAPDNLFQTLPGDAGAHGRFDENARSSSMWVALRFARGKAAAGVLAAGATLATMGLRSRR